MIEQYLPINWNIDERHKLTYDHSILVAKSAGKIAKACGMDHQKAFIFGEMHDIGKFWLKTSEYFKHGLKGYELFRDTHPDIANICITHTFPGFAPEHIAQVLSREQSLIPKVIQILDSIQIDEYIELIQLCDKISSAEGYVSLDEKMQYYHKIKGIPIDTLEKCYFKVLRRIQSDFERKAGCSLFKIIESKSEVAGY